MSDKWYTSQHTNFAAVTEKASSSQEVFRYAEIQRDSMIS